MNLILILSILMLPPFYKTIYDFDLSSGVKGWYVVDDSVMGGRSAGNFDLTEEGHALFHGTVSLENNGGFSSVRYQTSPVALDGAKKIRLKVKGDGKQYQLRIKDSTKTYYSYVGTFSTNGKWQQIDIKLKDMYPSFRGMMVNQPNFDKESIEELAFLIANKKAENFYLEIDKIELLP